MKRELELQKEKIVTNFIPGSYLDAQEERRGKLELLKSKLLDLIVTWYEWNGADHPRLQKEREERLHEIYTEMIKRMQDYDNFMWDYKKDWDLNFDDYN